jgi:hypothetical protein
MKISAKSKFDYNSIKALTHLSFSKKTEPRKSFRLQIITLGIVSVLNLLIPKFQPDTIQTVLSGACIFTIMYACFFYFILNMYQI